MGSITFSLSPNHHPHDGNNPYHCDGCGLGFEAWGVSTAREHGLARLGH